MFTKDCRVLNIVFSVIIDYISRRGAVNAEINNILYKRYIDIFSAYSAPLRDIS